MSERIWEEWRFRTWVRWLWTEKHGRDLWSWPKLKKSCSAKRRSEDWSAFGSSFIINLTALICRFSSYPLASLYFYMVFISHQSNTDILRWNNHWDLLSNACTHIIYNQLTIPLCAIYISSRNVVTNHVKTSDKYMHHLLYHYETLHFVTQCIYVFHMILAINTCCSTKQH
jgi:hypothetical protein